ncbi:hypothetical protein [Nocardia panacis]|uniref:hypothetical protein n=1 Tax=Nocardia panacis TaxID=2340916 RepID=UPI0011C41D52|nr:hypothetical protein [Nocardia panacis]
MQPPFTPPVSFSDTFDRADSTNLGPWTETGGDLGIIGRMLAVQGTGAGRRAAIYNTPTSTPYQSVEFTIGTAPNNTAAAGAVLRCNSTMTDMIILSVASTQWALGILRGGINGTFTLMKSQSATITAGTVIRVEVDQDNQWRVYVNGTRSGLGALDATWADDDHRYLGLFVQRYGSTNSAGLRNFNGRDTVPLSVAVFDDFNAVRLGPNWVTSGGGTLYLSDGELCAVGLPSSPVSFAHHTAVLPSDTQIARARIRWHGRSPEHSSLSVAVRANPGVHAGVHFWCTATLMGICIYTLDGVSFKAATGTADYVSTGGAFPDGAVMEIRAEGTVYTASVNSNPLLQGTFTEAQAPLSNHFSGLHGEDDSGVSGGGQPPAALDDFMAAVVV